MFRLLVSLVVLSGLLLLGHSRPDGAPSSACSSLTPRHGDYKAQRSSSPYSVSVIRNGDKFRIVISSETGEEFEGFVLQARSQKDKNKMVDGRFSSRSGISRTIDCGGRQNTLTQVNTSPKREIVTEWTPSRSVDEQVIFRATVAKSFVIFWTEVDSAPVRVRNAGFTANKQSSESSEDGGYQDCKESRKGCFGLPPNCIEQNDCDILLSYTSDNGGVTFQMRGPMDANTYMAVGLSYDRSMGRDAVYECVRVGSDIMVRESYNPEKSNTRLRQLPRSGYKSDFTDGVATCSFTLNYLTVTNGMRFDLANSTYNLLLARGPMNSQDLGYHLNSRTASLRAVNFTAFESIESEGTTDSVKIHGTFMVTAWVGFVSLAILLARHFKSAMETKTICNVKVWFAFHRGLMIVALTFICIAFIVIFVHKDGWNYETKNPHAILGCIATAMALFQPIMAMFRPNPDDPKRPIFNYLHFSVGNGAQLIAVITMFFAVSLPSSGLNANFYWVLGIFIIIHLIFHFLFQLHSWTAGRKKTNEIKMHEMSSGRGTVSNFTSEKSLADNVFRNLLLGIYALFLIVIILPLYALIGVA